MMKIQSALALGVLVSVAVLLTSACQNTQHTDLGNHRDEARHVPNDAKGSNESESLDVTAKGTTESTGSNETLSTKQGGGEDSAASSTPLTTEESTPTNEEAKVQPGPENDAESTQGAKAEEKSASGETAVSAQVEKTATEEPTTPEESVTEGEPGVSKEQEPAKETDPAKGEAEKATETEVKPEENTEGEPGDKPQEKPEEKPTDKPEEAPKEPETIIQVVEKIVKKYEIPPQNTDEYDALLQKVTLEDAFTLYRLKATAALAKPQGEAITDDDIATMTQLTGVFLAKASYLAHKKRDSAKEDDDKKQEKGKNGTDSESTGDESLQWLSAADVMINVLERLPVDRVNQDWLMIQKSLSDLLAREYESATHKLKRTLDEVIKRVPLDLQEVYFTSDLEDKTTGRLKYRHSNEFLAGSAIVIVINYQYLSGVKVDEAGNYHYSAKIVMELRDDQGELVKLFGKGGVHTRFSSGDQKRRPEEPYYLRSPRQLARSIKPGEYDLKITMTDEVTSIARSKTLKLIVIDPIDRKGVRNRD